jgi:hypothetical protein
MKLYFSLFFLFLVLRIAYFIEHYGEQASLCRRHHKDILLQFAKEQWLLARTNLNMDHQERILSKQDILYIHDFNAGKMGGLIYSPLKSNSTITYIRIWKCANTAINRNLERMCLPPGTNTHKYATAKHFRTYKQLQEYHREISTKRCGNVDMPIFTFIRDPMSHFYSGIAEVIHLTYFYRSMEAKKRNESVINDKNVTIQEMQGYLQDILNFQSPFKWMHHLRRQSSAFLTYDIDIIGHLEHFLDDWNKYIVPRYNITSNFDLKEGAHPSSVSHPIAEKGDTIGAREALAEVLNNTKYMEAICRLLLVDYVCLPIYPLPTSCQGLESTRKEMIGTLYISTISI